MKGIIILLVIVIGISGFIGFQMFGNPFESITPQDYSQVNFFSQGIPSFTIVDFSAMECRYVNSMLAKYEGDSQFYGVASDNSGDFNPQIQFDVTNRNDGRLIDKIRVDIKHNCGFYDDSWKQGVTSIHVSGSVVFQPFTGAIGDEFGNELLPPTIKPVSKTMNQDEWTVIASYTFDVQPLESDLILHNDVNAWIKVFANPTVDYRLNYVDGTKQDVGSSLGYGTLSAWLVRADANVINPPEANANVSNEPIFLDDIRTTLSESQGGQSGTISDTNPLDTNKSTGRQLEITGTVRKWLDSEGLPEIKILEPSGLQLVKFTMLFDGKEGDDGKFVGYFSMPYQTENGRYTVVMTHPTRFQGDFATPQESKMTFIVENSETTQSTDFGDSQTGDSGGSGDDSETTPTSSTPDSFFGRVILAWTSVYTDGSSQSGIVGEDKGFSNELSLSLANRVDDNNKVLKSVQVTPVLQFEDDETTSMFTIETSDVVFDTKIQIGTETVTLDRRNAQLFQPTKALCVDEATGTTCANEGFSLGSVIISSDAVENKIENTNTFNSLPQGGTAGTKIVIDISGEFTARNNDDGKARSGALTGSQFIWETTYIKGVLGQQVTTNTDEDGNTTTTTTSDDESSSSENPEKELEENTDNTCKFREDGWLYSQETCDSIKEFEQEIKSRQDGTCHTKKFADSQGIQRDVTICSALDDSIDEGGASGSAGDAGSGLGNNSDGSNASGNSGLFGICEGTIIQCASAVTSEFDKRLEENIGFDFLELGMIGVGLIIVFIVIGILMAIAKRRNNTYNPMMIR